MKSLLADDDDVFEILETVGSRPVRAEVSVNLALQEDFGYAEIWGPAQDCDSNYWGLMENMRRGRMRDPTSYLTSNELQQVEDPYHVANSKFRSFVDARKAVKARRVRRAFDPFSTGARARAKARFWAFEGQASPAREVVHFPLDDEGERYLWHCSWTTWSGSRNHQSETPAMFDSGVDADALWSRKSKRMSLETLLPLYLVLSSWRPRFL